MESRRQLLAGLSALALGALAAGCAGAPESADEGTTAWVGRPYTIKGVVYRPRSQPSYDEVGLASWYGPGFHGKTTANGERYDMYGLTAAHKTLPFGTKVRVTNLANERSLVVRINDRGPFVAGRIIDLSKRAAERLGFLEAGKAKVRVEVIAG